MPRGDRTGPNGMGRMTGRTAGYCAGYDRPGFANAGFGRRMGFGRGMRGGFRGAYGRGFGYSPTAPNCYGAPDTWTAPSREQELESLKAQAAGYEQGLKDITRRIGELESESE